MSWKDKLKQRFKVEERLELLKKISFPGLQGKSIFGVGRFFIKAVSDFDFNMRASALSFNFFLAIFPALLFLFSTVPYWPIEGLEEKLMVQLAKALPEQIFEMIYSTVHDIVGEENSGVLSFGILSALYFSSNGILSLIRSFDKYSEKIRSWWVSRLRAIALTLVIVILVILGVAVYTFGQIGVNWVFDIVDISDGFQKFAITGFTYLTFVAIVYFIFAILFYYGSAVTSHWRFFSAGTTIASVLSILATRGFSFYITHFDSYNRLYGSIGTVIALCILVYINCVAIIVGFELNSSIERAEFIDR